MPKITKTSRIVFITSILLAMILTSWYLIRPEPIEVELATIASGMVEATVVNTRAGTVKACRRSNLAPVAGGQIVKLWVNEGDRVKKGQILLELWNSDLVAQRELAQRQLAMAKEHRREACILAENARRESKRTQQLVEKGFISPQRAEDDEANARARQASCDAAASDIKRAQAQIQVVEAQMKRTILQAPFSGVIARITGELGEFTTPSPPGIPTPAAVDLIDDSCIYVNAPMDEVDAPKIKIGQPARITLDAMPGKIFAGKVRRIAPYVTEIEKQARTVDIEVDFIRPTKDTLLVGYSADVEAIIERHSNVLRIPTQAIRQDNKVLVVGADSKLEERQIETGLANWSYAEIINGLEAGDLVLLSFDRDDVEAGVLVKQKAHQP